MKTTKLTSAQIENLSIALAHQFAGKTIGIGNKFGYNENNVYVGKMRFNNEQRLNFLDSDDIIGNKVFGKCLLSTNCFERIESSYNTFHFFIQLNVEKIMQFSNGQQVINNAIQIIASK